MLSYTHTLAGSAVSAVAIWNVEDWPPVHDDNRAIVPCRIRAEYEQAADGTWEPDTVYVSGHAQGLPGGHMSTFEFSWPLTSDLAAVTNLVVTEGPPWNRPYSKGGAS